MARAVGRRGGIMRDPDYADLARLRTLITYVPVPAGDRNQGYPASSDASTTGRWVCVLTPRLDDVPDA